MAGNYNDIVKEISRVVKFHRAKSGLNQKQLADLAGIGKTSVFDIEKEKDSVRLNTLLKVLKVLNIELKLESPLMNLMKDKNENS